MNKPNDVDLALCRVYQLGLGQLSEFARAIRPANALLETRATAVVALGLACPHSHASSTPSGLREVDTAQRTPVARQIRDIFNAGDAIEAQRLLNAALKDWQLSQPQLPAWAENNLPEGFAVLDLSEAHRVRMRTINALERLSKELKRSKPRCHFVPQPCQLPAPGQCPASRTR